MKLSLEWLRDYVDLPGDLPVATLMHDLTMTTVEVESAAAIDGDTVFEIDNKSLTNRPDLWGHYGIARELAAIYTLPLKPLVGPLSSLLPARPPTAPLVGAIDPECRRFTATAFSNVRPGESPAWLRARLARVGQSSINLWVDLTNYVMLDTGQPLHAYDAKTLALPLGTRMARTGERTRLLNGEEYELGDGILTIVDGRTIVGIAGVMGGHDSSVTAATTEIVLECANFDPLTIRRASRRLTLRTDASSRFEKGIDTPRIDLAVARFVSLVREIQPDAAVDAVADVCRAPTEPGRITTSLDYLESRLGATLHEDEVTRGLEALGFDVEMRGRELDVTVPTWRATGDVSGPHDLLEEIARLKGYDNFAFVPAEVQLVKTTLDARAQFERRLRDLLTLTGGMYEVVTYPWAKREFLDAAGGDASRAPKLHVAPAPDQDTVRPSLIPNLLEAVAQNLGFFDTFRIFELGRVFPGGATPGDHPEEQLPVQPRHLAGALAGPDAAALFREAQGLLELLPRVTHGAPMTLQAAGGPPWADATARIALTGPDGPVGTLAVVTKRARRRAGIKRGELVMFELDLDALAPLPSRTNRFDPIANYPQADVDISLLFDAAAPWQAIAAGAASAGDEVREVVFVDDYRGKGVPEGRKSITLRLRIGVPGRTLRSEEINAIGDRARAALRQRLGAEDRSA
ncbi:MAG TPA: phenylalanine--tRNA ligase subunit beta [Vicinamibacterales bacterium]|nr:phenylalanine--tRNA ligase subunit beta [Vicinamibacterales bacterium]